MKYSLPAKTSSRARRSAPFAALLLGGTALSCVPTAAHAQSKWNGGTSVDWFDPTNWTPNGVPTSSTDTVIDTQTPNTTEINTATAAADSLTIGDTAMGRLTIVNTGKLTSDSGVIGAQLGSSGSVSLSGGSSWSIKDDLYIGQGGSGSLAISSAATVEDTNAYIGFSTGSVGMATVDGAGSSWSNDNRLVVGGGDAAGTSGQGTLMISNGALVTADATIIGYTEGSVGLVTVTGSGSELVSSGQGIAVGSLGSGTLQILAGAFAQGFDVYVGGASTDAQHPSTGFVAIDGAGSVFETDHGLYVGGSDGQFLATNATGTVAVTNGGQLDSIANFIVGSSAGATGNVTVDGAGSQLQLQGDLRIGDFGGTGTVSFSNQAMGTIVDNVLIANTADSTGTLIVDGAQTQVAANSIQVGVDGTGTVEVRNGGLLQINGLIVASDPLSIGTVTVTDAGSALTIVGDADIGADGTGTLSILAGATMTDHRANIGADSGPGTVTVDGTGSSWITTDTLAIGDNGMGTLNIQSGGAVISVTGEVGLDNAGNGTVNLMGQGSSWTATQIDLGDFGTGAMTVSDGGALSYSGLRIGSQTGSTGVLLVTGAGSTLTGAAFTTIGGGGTGIMNILDGAAVNGDIGEIGGDTGGVGFVTVDGAGSSWTNTGFINVGNAGIGMLTVSNGGVASADTGLVAYQANSSGTIVVDGAGSTLTFGSSMSLGRFGTGTLTVSNGGTLTSLGGTVIAANAGAAGTLNIGADAASAAAGAGTVNATVIAFGDGTGTINFNHTSQNYTFAASIAGFGTINTYAGVTHLTADSSGFSGPTNVLGGTLLVDNNLGTGPIDVLTGGTVGGIGKTSGTVDVADGGTLLGVQGQTFTMGNLNLAGGANVDVTLDTPGGGALFNVTGNLVLDGTLNITTPGAFGPGVYALFTYGGTKTDNILDIGTTPTGTDASEFSIQTSVAGQVNLVDVQPLDRAFWDGDASGSANNGAVDGGSGVWSATNTNWTDVTAATNGTMTPQPGFAIFQTTGGTVTVDGSAGAIAVTGMQFATDGYNVVGDPITLADSDSKVRVGDGSMAGASYIATIGSALTGSGGLEKTDLGTLKLTGINDYTGATAVTDGTLALVGTGSIAQSSSINVSTSGTLDIAATSNGASITTLLGSGTVNLGAQTLTLTNAQDNFNGVIAGTGGLTVIQGDEVLFGTNAYTGKTNIVGGTLGVGGSGSIQASSGVVIAASGTFDISQTANGGPIQSVSGAGNIVLGNQFLVLTNASDQFDGVISGAGGLEMLGGTEKLSGINTYINATNIVESTLALVGNGSIASSAGIDMHSGTFDISATNAGAAIQTIIGSGSVVLGAQTLTLTNAQNLQFDGVISGTGGLTIANGGMTFTGANTYTGGTIIGATAALVLSGEGSIVGNVQDNHGLGFTRTADLTFGGTISGSGSVSQAGSGIITLTGANTYTGGTAIETGSTLIGSATSFGSDIVADDGELVIDQPTDAAFANVIAGAGTFTKQGAGILTLTSDSSGLTGATTVATGRLSVNGSLANSVVTVKSGANLGGNGTVGGVIAESGSTIAPGNSIGLLHVAGDYNQAAGSTYQVELNPAGQSDRIDVTGTATIASGALLAVTNTGTGSYAFGTQYKVLDAAGGISGTYTLANMQISAFMGLALSYDANDVYLDVTKTASFASAGSTPNQTAVGAVLDTMPVTNAIVGAVVLMPDFATADAAFDQLSGEIHASAKTAMLEDGRLVRDAAIGRLLGGQDRGTGLWGTYTGSWAKNDGNGNAATLTHNATSFVLGLDTSPARGFTLGVLGGYTRTDARLPARASSAKIKSYTVGVYAGAAAGPLKLRIGGAYSWQSLDTDRSVTFAGFSDKLSANYDASTAQAFGDVGYTIGSERLNLEPFAQIAWEDVATGAFAETGGAAALEATKQSRDLGIVTLGVRGVAGFSIAGAGARLHATAGWRTTSGDRIPDATLSFVSGGSAFDIAGAPIAKNSATLDAGLDVAVTPTLRLNLGYVGQISSTTRDNGVKAGLSMAF